MVEMVDKSQNLGVFQLIISDIKLFRLNEK